MQRNLAKHLLVQLQSARSSSQRFQIQSVRSLATVNEIFQNKSEFPTRHIGPRKTDVVSMLDLLGFKVIKSEFLMPPITKMKFLDPRRADRQSCAQKDQIRSRFDDRRTLE